MNYHDYLQFMSLVDVFKAGWGLLFGGLGLVVLITGIIAVFDGIVGGDIWGGIGALVLSAIIAVVLFGIAMIGITKKEPGNPVK